MPLDLDFEVNNKEFFSSSMSHSTAEHTNIKKLCLFGIKPGVLHFYLLKLEICKEEVH